MKTQEENPEGLYVKYRVEKSDGTPVDPNAVYFVLRLDFSECDQENNPEHMGKRRHIRACRAALWTYCNEIQSVPPLAQLARELRQLLRNTELDMSDWGEGYGQT